jgi:redox-sensitive bicupin YhaK (pirin superfamily)
MRPLYPALLFSFLAAPAFAAPQLVIDNERVTVWDVKLAPGEDAPPTPAAFDTITVFLEGGTIRTRHAEGKVTTATRSFGDAVFTPKGSGAVDMSDHAHEVVIALKGGPAGPNSGPDGIPNAFPRAGSEKIFENDRVVVSRFSWTPGVPVPMHHHDKDTVMAFRYDGPIRSTGMDGKSEILDFRKDQIMFSKAGRTHGELLAGDRQSAVMTELK